jgi:hypothetical protein
VNAVAVPATLCFVRLVGLVIVTLCGIAMTAAAAPKAQQTTARKVAKKHSKAKKHKSYKRSRSEFPDDATSTPAYRYNTMSAASCEAELVARKIPFVREGTQAGVLAPVRLTGTLHGVEFRTNLKEAARATTPWEIADCRLVLALDDFAQILEAHGVVDVRHYSMYRVPSKSWPTDKEASRHNGALAIDAARFNLKDGSYLDVDKHFHGAIGAKTCGEGAAPRRAIPEAVALRAILCEAVAKRIFNVVLTPNYNRPHKNHFHLEVTAGWKSFLVH